MTYKKSEWLDYGFLKGARNMPPLTHRETGSEYDIMKSEVAEYLCSLPEVREKVFGMAKRKKLIVFKDGKWKGIDYDDH